ncbi:HAD-IIIC family phosphatase [uncultured Bacteroides sp.]|uniref:HAD-IIIC family phosphatase n=1 Tax=uncultured Bacteroides sp. TaxID=162156 RepID=UPI002AAAF4F1|nr:HAD-IIIC family phosphatase [uncultured Bacteroides sp.]
MLTFKELRRNLKRDTINLPTIKVALLGDTATQFLAIALKGIAIEKGYNLNLFEAEFNQVERLIMDPTSDLFQFSPDYTIIFQSTHKFLDKFGSTKSETRKNIAEERLSFVEMASQKVAGKIICYNYPEIDDTIFGNLANQIEESFIYQIRKLNYGLMQLAQKHQNLYICDLSSIQNKIGRDVMFNASIYTSTEMILSIDSLPIIASRTIDLICASKGNIKKCLILDLDNTLWGGIIGDDGIENIQLGHGLGIGKAFTEFQRWIKKLKERGIILAICSKNTESLAREPFEKHPEMILRLDDIAVFVANWDNKADNIRHIQSVLNIGFDSMVYLDDNPFERNMVRENVSGILVPELPPDPADYLEFIYNLNLFETISYSSGDKDRTKQYQLEAQRVFTQKEFTNEADFLQSLGMISIVEGFTKFNTPRVAQLSQRSNQFNLRTIRYTEGDINKLSKDPDYHCFSFTLEDKFGDNGLICIIIMQNKDHNNLFIDTWLMSCRVLKRGMENFTLNTIVEYAKTKGYKKITGEYLPTVKNLIVADHYSTLGFEPLNENRWVLDVDKYKKRDCYINEI